MRVPRRYWIAIERGWRQKSVRWRAFRVALPPEELATHVLVIGATGSGKTNLLHHLLVQDILLGVSFVILDLRGTLVDDVLDFVAGRRHPADVFLLDLRDKRNPSGFDPLSGEGEAYFRALGVLAAVESESESWGVQLAESLRYALLLLAETGTPLTKIERLFFDSKFLLDLLGRLPLNATRGFWERFLELSGDRKSALASPVLNKVSMLLATESLRRVFGHPRPINLARHLNRPGSVTLVSLAADELHAAGRMAGRIFLASLCREIFARVGIPESRRNPVRLYVDEFENFGSQEFESILAEGRKFKFSAVLAHQTLGQLSPKLRSLILNNVGCKVVLRTGREDAALLSRDLTGDPKALDLPTLKTGEAILWTRTQGLREIEVNAPINRGEGARTPAAHALVRAIRQHSGWRKTDSEPERSAAKPTPLLGSEKPRQPHPRTSLEDWLCE